MYEQFRARIKTEVRNFKTGIYKELEKKQHSNVPDVHSELKDEITKLDIQIRDISQTLDEFRDQIFEKLHDIENAINEVQTPSNFNINQQNIILATGNNRDQDIDERNTSSNKLDLSLGQSKGSKSSKKKQNAWAWVKPQQLVSLPFSEQSSGDDDFIFILIEKGDEDDPDAQTQIYHCSKLTTLYLSPNVSRKLLTNSTISSFTIAIQKEFFPYFKYIMDLASGKAIPYESLGRHSINCSVYSGYFEKDEKQ